MGWLLLARAEMERQLRSPLRDWAKVDAALNKAKDLLGETTDVLATEVELTAAKGDNAGAAKMLEEGLKSKPDELFPFAVLFYERSGRADDANKALDQWKELRGADDRQVRLLELQIYRRQKNYDGAKALLLTLLKESTGEEERDLRRQLAMLELEHDDAGGRQALLALAQRYPDSPWPLERLADLAFAARDDQALAKYESALQKAEGPDGSIWRFYRAMRLLNQASDPNDERLVEATQLVSELQSLRPMWPRVLHLKARLAQKQNRVQESIEAYQAAIEAGETSITLYEGLVALLYANNRWAEADQLLSRLNQRDQSPLLESFSSRVLLKRGQIDEAVAAAKSAVQMRPKDPLAYIWLGQTLSAASRQSPKQDERDNLWKDAKSALEQAVALAPEDAGAWSALLSFRVRAGDKEGAQAAIEAIQTKVNLPKPKHALAIAQGYQLLGEYQLADKHFREAVQLSPRDPEAQERLLQFYLAYSPEKGEQAARRLLELEPTSDLARRTLATLLATQGSDSQFEEAIQLLRGSADDAANRRLHALLLMRRGGKTNLAEAHSILSGLVNQAATPSAMDRRLLALVAEAEGDLETARNQLEALAGDGGSASYLATLIDFLLRHKQPKEAEPLVNRLISLEPNSFVTTQLHARWMQASERPASDIEGVIQSYLTAAIKAAAGAPQQVAVVKGAASLFTQLSMQPQAEAAFRGLLRDFPSDAARQALAMWLVGQERFGEAVQVALDGIRADMPTDASAQLLGNVLVLASSRGVRFNDAERTLEELVAAKGQNANLLVELATLKHIQGDRDARRVYERAIQLAPRNALARNNLAMLLLEQPATYGESLKNIKEALQYAGPLPDLKDTEALALMQLGNTEEAVRILRILLAQSPGNARFLFHLAIAYDKAGNKSAAREELQKALGKNLKQEVLTPMERALLAELHPLVATSLE
jgi:tetratricopeptide (TPR) repeat protein